MPTMPSATPYTPISTTPSPTAPVDLSYISQAKQRVYSTLATWRPWAQLLAFRSLSFPRSMSECFERLRANLGYFRVNLSVWVLLVLFLALLWHPISLLVLMVMMAAWLFLFFMRDEPLVVLGRTIHDRLVLAALAVLTLAFLFLTSATVNILVGLAVGLDTAVLYSLFRRTDDLFLDEADAAASGLIGASTAA